MKPAFWLERWETNRIGFHQRDINPLLRAHWNRVKAPPHAKVFVPLCGKSRDMLWLHARGYQVLGVEFIRIALQDFFRESGLTPNVSARAPFERWEANGLSLWHGDFFDLTAADLEGVGAVYDRASLIALPTDMRRRYVDKMASILPPDAEILLITLTYPEGEMNGPPFSVADAEVRALFAAHFHIERLGTQDALGQSGHLRERGLTQLAERAYRIHRKRAGQA